MENTLSTTEARIYKIFLRAHASIMRDLEATLQAKIGISVTWLDLLTQLALADDHRMTHTRLSQRLLVGGSGGITRLVDRMAKAGLVTRRASRKDRRTSYVVMTKTGSDVFRRGSEEGIVVVQERFMNHLRKEEMPAIFDFFRRVMGEAAHSSSGANQRRQRGGSRKQPGPSHAGPENETSLP